MNKSPKPPFSPPLDSTREDAQEPSSLFFLGLPFPPSSNSQYKLFKRGKKVYHVPSDELKRFRISFATRFAFLPDYLEHMLTVQKWVAGGYALGINCVFFFESKKLFTLQGNPKKIDVSNRFKATHDAVATLLGIDDSLFWEVRGKKADGKDKCWVDIEIFRIPFNPEPEPLSCPDYVL